MMEAKLAEDRVIIDDPAGKELHESGWYGNVEDGKLVLDLMEAVLLVERGRIEIASGEKKLNFNEFYHYVSTREERFLARYNVYRDLRERGLPVRTGFRGSDFRVYERGAKAGQAENVKWIVFAASEDYPAALEQLGKAIKLAQNIRALALWAVVDNDLDVTYYIINELVP